MTNTRNQYLLEAQQRYLKFLQAEESQEAKVRDRIIEQNTLVKEKKKTRKPISNVATLAQNEAPENTQLTMDRYFTTKYKVYNIIIDSAFRDTQVYPLANDFVVKMAEYMRNVFAIRMLRTEYFQPTHCTNYFVFNNIRIPVQTFATENAYLYLNGYTSTNVANEANTQFFGRITPGTEVYPAVSGNILYDPYAYIMQPIEQRMRRFHVKLLQPDGTVYTVEPNARVVMTLAVYCLTFSG